MAISAEQLLKRLDSGCYITTFYRLPAKAVSQSLARIPEGYILMSKEGVEETILNPLEFQSIKHSLTERDTWQNVVGPTLFGGSSWFLKKIWLFFYTN
ncbi:cytoplasmic protein (plasmid) [Providencia rettgeri]|uniref:Cytoplasmic protein n=2 Tax=Providencia rettgeri TaxID=587 RepID=A0AAJ6K4K9_PRORE|nr:cytoplasmic protein [Providencia rettgeri]WHT95728.1 cytoplasmic protein [Providencia rettgeri]